MMPKDKKADVVVLRDIIYAAEVKKYTKIQKYKK